MSSRFLGFYLFLLLTLPGAPFPRGERAGGLGQKEAAPKTWAKISAINSCSKLAVYKKKTWGESTTKGKQPEGCLLLPHVFGTGTAPLEHGGNRHRHERHKKTRGAFAPCEALVFLGLLCNEVVGGGAWAV